MLAAATTKAGLDVERQRHLIMESPQRQQPEPEPHQFQWAVVKEQIGTLVRELSTARRDLDALRASIEQEIISPLRETKQGLQQELRERVAMQERFDKRLADHRELLTHEVARVAGESHARNLELRELLAEQTSGEKIARDTHFSRIEDALAADRKAQDSRNRTVQGSVEKLESAVQSELARVADEQVAMSTSALRELHAEHAAGIESRFAGERAAREEHRGALLTSLEALEALKSDMDRKLNRDDLEALLGNERDRTQAVRHGGAWEGSEQATLSTRVRSLEDENGRMWKAMDTHTHTVGSLRGPELTSPASPVETLPPSPPQSSAPRSASCGPLGRSSSHRADAGCSAAVAAVPPKRAQTPVRLRGSSAALGPDPSRVPGCSAPAQAPALQAQAPQAAMLPAFQRQLNSVAPALSQGLSGSRASGALTPQSPFMFAGAR